MVTKKEDGWSSSIIGESPDIGESSDFDQESRGVEDSVPSKKKDQEQQEQAVRYLREIFLSALQNRSSASLKDFFAETKLPNLDQVSFENLPQAEGNTPSDEGATPSADGNTASAIYEEAVTAWLVPVLSADPEERSRLQREMADDPEKQFGVLAELYAKHAELYSKHRDKALFVCGYLCEKFAEKLIADLATYISGKAEIVREQEMMTWLNEQIPAILETSPELLTLLAEQLITVAGASDVFLIRDFLRYERMANWEKNLFQARLAYRAALWGVVLTAVLGGGWGAYQVKRGSPAVEKVTTTPAFAITATTRPQPPTRIVVRGDAGKKAENGGDDLPDQERMSLKVRFISVLTEGLVISSAGNGLLAHMKGLVDEARKFVDREQKSLLAESIDAFEAEYRRVTNADLQDWIRSLNNGVERVEFLLPDQRVFLVPTSSVSKFGFEKPSAGVAEPQIIACFRNIGSAL